MDDGAPHRRALSPASELDPRRAREPLMYYTRTGPLGDVFAEIPARAGRRVAVVGLGIGTIACYRAPGEDWRFYEIDAAVERLARNPAYFSFLARCAPEVPVEIGDARLSLERAPLQVDRTRQHVDFRVDLAQAEIGDHADLVD